MIMMEDQKLKQDAGKPQIDLVPVEAVYSIAKIREYGNNKYGDDNAWRTLEPRRLANAAARHLLKMFENGIDAEDEESTFMHAEHLLCNAAMIVQIVRDQQKEKQEERKRIDEILDAARYAVGSAPTLDCPSMPAPDEVPTVKKVLFDWDGIEKPAPLLSKDEEYQKKLLELSKPKVPTMPSPLQEALKQAEENLAKLTRERECPRQGAAALGIEKTSARINTPTKNKKARKSKISGKKKKKNKR